MPKKDLDVNTMTRKEFEALPYRESFHSEEGLFDSLVILPTRFIHDSGFRQMDFVLVKDNVPRCRLSGCSDVLHIGGIGGFGSRDSGVPFEDRYWQPPRGWSLDCLKKSGLLRLFLSQGKMSAGPALSSFEIFAEIPGLENAKGLFRKPPVPQNIERHGPIDLSPERKVYWRKRKKTGSKS